MFLGGTKNLQKIIIKNMVVLAESQSKEYMTHGIRCY